MKRGRKKKEALGDLYTTPPNRPPYGEFGAPSHEACGPVLPKTTVQLCLKRKGPPGKQMRNSTDACRFVRSMEDAAEENFMVLHLDVRNRIIGVDHVGKGSVSGVEVHPREVFKSALLNNASALIFAHNHPSGEISPSSQDRELTSRLKQGADLFSVAVLDHVIVGSQGCTSMAEQGWLGTAGAKYPKPAEKK